MSLDRAGVGPAVLEVRSRGCLAMFAVVAAALMIHLFGPAVPTSTAAESTAHGHSILEIGPAHVSDAAAESVAEAHDEESCHSVVGVTPGASPLQVSPCFATTWRVTPALASDRSGLRPAWIGGDGGDASLDPRRSPGVQRT